jgi:hypothetical protein
VNLQTLEFPSLAPDKEKERKKEGRPIDEINYEIFRTGGGLLPVGVKLLVVFEISKL